MLMPAPRSGWPITSSYPSVAERAGGRHEAAITGPQRDLEEQPARSGRALGDQLELLRPHARGIARRDLSARQDVERDPRGGQDLTKRVDTAVELAQPELAGVRRAYDSPRPVGHGELRQRDRIAVVARAVVDAGKEMEVKLGAHPNVFYPPRIAQVSARCGRTTG